MREIRTSGSTRGQQAAFGHLLSYSTGQYLCLLKLNKTSPQDYQLWMNTE
jgi:hypothetical protein